MGRKLFLMLLTVLLAVATMPGIAMADDDDDDWDDDWDDRDGIYLSLGTSLAAGTYADSAGNSVPFSSRSYTDRLYRTLLRRVDDDMRHVKLGCPGETTDQFMGRTNIAGNPSFCSGDYVSGSQIGDALATLATGDVVLVTLDIGANDILQLQNWCLANDPGNLAGCIGEGIELDIIPGVVEMLLALRSSGYTGPIVGSLYYNPQIAASAGFFAGFPGPGPADVGLALLSDGLAVGFNDALRAVYGAFGSPVADWYEAFKAGENPAHTASFDDGGRYQVAGNGVWDATDAVCILTSMCPEFPAKANIHPTRKGYRVMAWALWKVVRTLDLDTDDDD
jgi:lysophospholipase L1-like esterase